MWPPQAPGIFRDTESLYFNETQTMWVCTKMSDTKGPSSVPHPILCLTPWSGDGADRPSSWVQTDAKMNSLASLAVAVLVQKGQWCSALQPLRSARWARICIGLLRRLLLKERLLRSERAGRSLNSFGRQGGRVRTRTTHRAAPRR